MKMTIEKTDQIVDLNNGVQARIWNGRTESGIEVICLVTRIAVRDDQDCSQFEKELMEQRAPSTSAVDAFPLRMIL